MPAEYILFDASGTVIKTSGGNQKKDWPKDQRHVYGRTAGWYVMDVETMTLERRAWWWR